MKMKLTAEQVQQLSDHYNIVVDTESMQYNLDGSEYGWETVTSSMLVNVGIFTGMILFVRDDGSCGDEYEQYIEWLSENYPDLELDADGSQSGLFDEYGNRITNNFWDKYCNAG